jgi:hypothetical protein
MDLNSRTTPGATAMPPGHRIRRLCARLHFLADILHKMRGAPASPPGVEDCVVQLEASAMLLEHQLDEQGSVAETLLPTLATRIGNGLPRPRTIGPRQLLTHIAEFDGRRDDPDIAGGDAHISCTLATTLLPAGSAPAARSSTARVLAGRLCDRAAEVAGFLDSAELPAGVELDVAACIAAADGLLSQAMKAIENAGPG